MAIKIKTGPLKSLLCAFLEAGDIVYTLKNYDSLFLIIKVTSAL